MVGKGSGNFMIFLGTFSVLNLSTLNSCVVQRSAVTGFSEWLESSLFLVCQSHYKIDLPEMGPP